MEHFTLTHPGEAWLLFAVGGKDDPVVEAAVAAMDSLVYALNLIIGETRARRDPFRGNELVQAGFTYADGWANQFAARANARIRTHWWRNVFAWFGHLRPEPRDDRAADNDQTPPGETITDPDTPLELPPDPDSRVPPA